MAIQNRRGLKKDFDPAKMLPGEWAVTIDPETENQMVYMCFAPGVVKRMGTYEDFKKQLDEAAVDREQIQANKTDITNLEKLAITPTATGTQIVARDTADWPLQALTVYGRSEQARTSGKNLYNKNSEYSNCFWQNGKTYAHTGYKTRFVGIENMPTVTISSKPGKVDHIYFSEVNSKEDGSDIISEGLISIGGSQTITTNGGKYLAVAIWIDEYEPVISAGIQVEAGTSATTYEPYTGGKPSPSPDYPQPIVSAGQKLNADGSITSSGIEVAVEGKNLFNPEKYVEIALARNNGSEVVQFDGRRCLHILTDAYDEAHPIYESFTVGAYALSFDTYIRSFGQGAGNGFAFKYEDGSKQYVVPNTNKATNKWISMFGATATDKKATGLFATYGAPSECYIDLGSIQLELHSAATAYEPYRGRQTVTLAANGLPGIPVTSGGNYTDADGQQWVCDTIEYRNGQAVYVKRVWSKTFTGGTEEDWQIYVTTGYEGFSVNNVLPTICTKMPGFCNLASVHASYSQGIEGLWIGGNKDKNIFVHNSSFYDSALADKGLANWKTYLAAHPMTVMTYLTTPIETPLTDTEVAQLAALHTYKPTTTITNDAGAEMDVTYVADTKAYIDNKFAELQTAQAITNAQLI